MNLRTLAAAAFATLAACALHAQEQTLWKPQDTAPLASTVYSVEVGRFPSLVLASSIEQTLSALNWGPVRTAEIDGRHAVLVGETASLVEAHAIMEELAAQKIADGAVVDATREMADTARREFHGPVLPPFHDPNDAKSDLVARRLALVQSAEDAARTLETTEQKVAAARAVELLKAKTFDDVALGDGLVFALGRLRDSGAATGDLLFGAERIARGEWAASPASKIAAMEVCADVYVGTSRDVRAAWFATQALLAEPQRTPEGRSRDLLRLEAIAALILASGDAPKPSLVEMRAHLRAAFENTPESAREIRARIGLLALQTFAWEGNWERVREFGEAYLSMFREEAAIYQVAAVFVARGYEETEEWKRAITLLEQAVAVRLTRTQRVRVGDRVVDARELASKWRAYFGQLEAGVASPERPPEMLLESPIKALAAATTVAEASTIDEKSPSTPR